MEPLFVPLPVWRIARIDQQSLQADDPSTPHFIPPITPELLRTVPAFLSYSHSDNDYTDGKLIAFVQLLEKEVRKQTGDTDFRIYMDWEGHGCGDERCHNGDVRPTRTLNRRS